ncbi:carboxypeptidase B-like [Plodia interpunctella]|uniref:carboxypeptidase B-like n=1 Tax=Plodia interpunctella TaxID=58824 RepID=UPI002367BBA5|nr:carboxypeptidase B-like isoform X2 [Plodia interpunctella]
MFREILFVCLSVYLVLAKHEEYDGSALYEVKVQNIQQAKILREMESQFVDVWSDAFPNRPGQVLVNKNMRKMFQEALTSAGIEYTVLSDNILEQILLEEKLLASSKGRSNNRNPRGGLSFDTIHEYDVVMDYITELGERYPDTVTVVDAGRSFEGRAIKYLKISSTNFQNQNKPIVYLESLLHAREWVTLPATLYAIEKLVIDVTEQDLIGDIDWIINPIANPDGYVHTHQSARFWRKNRATGYSVGDLCVGVDLNRNFDIFWSTASSNNACSDTFHGRGPFSEPETAIIRDIINEYGNRIELFLDIHSFGSMILYGYGNGQFPANSLAIHVAGVNMAQAIDAVKLPQKPNYIVGNVFLVLYAASGSASDYGTGMGIPYSYTYELPASLGNGNSLLGFMVNTDFIEQAGYETWEGIKNGARHALDNWRRTRNM